MKLHSQIVRISQVPPFPRAENMQSCKGLKLGLLPSKIVSSLTNPSLGPRLNLITAAYAAIPEWILPGTVTAAFCDLC